MNYSISNYKTLLNAISAFDISWLESVGVSGNRESIERGIKGNEIYKVELIKEFKEAFELTNFDWRILAKELNIIHKNDLNLYESNDIKQLVGFYLFPFIHPDFTDFNFSKVEKIIYLESNSLCNDDGWISANLLVKRIKKDIEYFEYYFLLEMVDRPYSKFEIQRENNDKLFSLKNLRIKKTANTM